MPGATRIYMHKKRASARSINLGRASARSKLEMRKRALNLDRARHHENKTRGKGAVMAMMLLGHHSKQIF